MNSLMHSLVVLTRFLEIAWPLGNFITVRKWMTTGDLILESILGGKREINIFRQETCGTCHGTGAKSSNGITECTRCRGQGRLMKTQSTPFGIVSQVNYLFLHEIHDVCDCFCSPPLLMWPTLLSIMDAKFTTITCLNYFLECNQILILWPLLYTKACRFLSW